jgi:uncharacterized protein (TIGR03790 family)
LNIKIIIYLSRIVGIVCPIAIMLACNTEALGPAWAGGRPENELKAEKPARGAPDVAVIVNDADPVSVRIGNYYKYRRHIPERNIIHVRFTPGSPTMSHAEFQRIKIEVDNATPGSVQGYALAWTQPYRVECMSITTAFAAGFDKAFCASTCEPTKSSPYFNSSSRKPYTDFGWRPTMMLAGRTYADVKKLIDRGVAADGTFPRGTGFLVSTSDKARNVRAVMYPEIAEEFFGSAFDLRLVKADFIKDRKNVLFYFTGMKQVEKLKTLRFAPGAIADHLTSAGGDLLGGSVQMSSLRWLEAGATGSYGAVSEPCNYLEKFPNPAIVINDYLAGETLLEAYWKSVAWPGQGVFIGEPLASPFKNRADMSREH